MKRWWGLLIATLVAAGAMLAGLAAPAHACSCAVPNAQEQLARADQVFTGTVVGQRRGPTSELYGQRAAVGFAVQDVYKGLVTRSTVVLAGTQEGSCGLRFVTGGRYTVFAHRDEDNPALMTTGLCDGPIDTAVVDATTSLGPPREPKPGGPLLAKGDDLPSEPRTSVDDPPGATRDESMTALIVGGGLGALAVAGGLGWVRWRRHTRALLAGPR